MNTPRVSALFLVFLPACHEARPRVTQGPVLELGFEDSCRPYAVAELGLEVSPGGITFTPGIEGRAAHFDDSGASVRLVGLERLELADSMTLEFFVNLADWQNPYGEGTVKNLVSHSDVFAVTVKGWALEARVTSAGAEKAQRFSGGSFAPGTWHHVALVLDGAQGSARLVLDGRDVAQTSVRGDIAIEPTLELVVGSWFEQEETFSGVLDSVRLWARALSAEELRARAALLAGDAVLSSASAGLQPGSVSSGSP